MALFANHFQELDKLLKDTMGCSIPLVEDLLQEEGGSTKYQGYISEVEESMLKLASLCHEVDLLQSSAVFPSLNSIHRETELKDPDDFREIFTAKLVSAQESSSQTFDPKKHPLYVEFAEALMDGDSEDEEIPSNDNADDELVVNKVQKSLYCPLTKKLLENAVTSKKCNHSYSSEAIMEHIRKRQSPKCPVCNEPLSATDLMPDKALRRMIRKKKRERSSGVTSDIVQL